MDNDKNRIAKENEFLFGKELFDTENLNEKSIGQIAKPWGLKKKAAYLGAGALIGGYLTNKFHKKYEIKRKDEEFKTKKKGKKPEYDQEEYDD
jgi:hypothetical protein